MPDDRRDPRWRAVELGLAVERLLDSPAVQQMILDAETKRAALAEQIVKLDPDLEADRSTFRQLRARIALLDTWQQFFADYVENGKAAADSLAGEDAPSGNEPLLENPDG